MAHSVQVVPKALPDLLESKDRKVQLELPVNKARPVLLGVWTAARWVSRECADHPGQPVAPAFAVEWVRPASLAAPAALV